MITAMFKGYRAVPWFAKTSRSLLNSRREISISFAPSTFMSMCSLANFRFMVASLSLLGSLVLSQFVVSDRIALMFVGRLYVYLYSTVPSSLPVGRVLM